VTTDSIPDIPEPQHPGPGDRSYDYDLLVIGSGPGGQKAAIAAAKLGKRVCVVERKHMVGGVCVNTGTIPSKTLREAVMYLTGMAQRDVYGASYRVKADITVQDLLARTQHVIGREVEVVRAQLLRNHVDLVSGMARFVDPHTVQVRGDAGAGDALLTPPRSSSPPAPPPPGRARWSSGRGWWTPTASSSWRRCRAPWSSPGQA
jgi:NAD(P) transhydrogenase